AFAARQVEKRYLAICHGILRAPRDVDAAIGRHPSRRQEMTVRATRRPDRTRLRPLADTASASLIEVELLTGRTHQVRVHLKSLKHPLVRDPLYRDASSHADTR